MFFFSDKSFKVLSFLRRTTVDHLIAHRKRNCYGRSSIVSLLIIGSFCSSFISLPRTSSRDFQPLLFHIVFQRGVFRRENGDDAMKKTQACHISIQRREVKQSGVFGQNLMVRAT